LFQGVSTPPSCMYVKLRYILTQVVEADELVLEEHRGQSDDFGSRRWSFGSGRTGEVLRSPAGFRSVPRRSRRFRSVPVSGHFVPCCHATFEDESIVDRPSPPSMPFSAPPIGSFVGVHEGGEVGDER